MYDTKTATEKPGLPDDTIFEAVIIDLREGIISDFVEDTTNWEKPQQKVLYVEIHTKHGEFTYKGQDFINIEEVDGRVVFDARSNLGKYKAKYQKLPEIGDRVKAIKNKKGYLKIKLE